MATVAPASADDAAALAAIQAAVIDEATWFITSPGELSTTPEDKRAWLDVTARRTNAAVLVARHEGRIAGYIVCEGGQLLRMRHCAKLEIYVRTEDRGLGVGDALVAAAVGWAENHPEITKLGLCVFADNDRAIQLYEKHGFVSEGRRMREYREADGGYRDDLLMARMV